MCLQIRSASRADVALLTGIVRDSFADVARRFALTPANCPKHPSNCEDRWITNAMSRGVEYYIAEQDGRPLGCAALEPADDKVCYLERLAVLPGVRRSGVGRRLVEHVMGQARLRQAARLEIGVIAAQSELIAWYETFGFRLTRQAAFPHLPFEVAFMAMEL